MKANNIRCVDYSDGGQSVVFVLDCAVDAALAMDTLAVDVTTDDGDLAARFVNLVKVSATVDASTRLVSLRCAAAEGGTAKVVADAVAIAKGAADAAREASDKAEQAANAANPELSTFAAMTLADMAPTMTDEQALSVPSLFAEWRVGADYEARQVVRYEGELYRVAQKHTAADEHRPGAGTESLYTRIEVDPSGVEVWQQPTGAHDAYPKGAIVKDPADGEAYRSKQDGNVWGPPSEQPQFWEPVG